MSSEISTQKSKDVIKFSANASGPRIVNTTYKAPQLGGSKDSDALDIEKLRSTLLHTTDSSVVDNIFLFDEQDGSGARLWFVVEPVMTKIIPKIVETPHGAEKLIKVVAPQPSRTFSSAVAALEKTNCIVVTAGMAKFTQPKDVLDKAECEKVDHVNSQRYQHNKVLVALLNELLVKNKCGTSANHITHSAPPDSFQLNMAKALAEKTKDPLNNASMACEYLYKAGLLPVKDYKLVDAVLTADAVSYFEAVYKNVKEIEQSKTKSKRLRVPGKPPSTWNGKDATDSQGTAVRWGASLSHMFWHVDVEPSFLSTTDPMHTVVMFGREGMRDSENVRSKFNSADRFLAVLSELSVEARINITKFCCENVQNAEAILKTESVHPLLELVQCLLQSKTTKEPAEEEKKRAPEQPASNHQNVAEQTARAPQSSAATASSAHTAAASSMASAIPANVKAASGEPEELSDIFVKNVERLAHQHVENVRVYSVNNSVALGTKMEQADLDAKKIEETFNEQFGSGADTISCRTYTGVPAFDSVLPLYDANDVFSENMKRILQTKQTSGGTQQSSEHVLPAQVMREICGDFNSYS